MTDDEERWRRICRRDADAFDAFYRENAPRLQAYLRHVVNNAHAAEDLVQDTFTQIWSRAGAFQPERGTLRAYLFGIGRNRAAEWWRKQSSLNTAVENEPSECRTETGSAVVEAFTRLPEEQKTLLWLREVEGQSYAELAAILDIPVGTVRSRLFAAREALRRVWHSGDESRKEIA